MNPTSRDEIRVVVKDLIISIKPLETGSEDIPDDAPLFDDGSGEPSPVELDSLDVLDLALAIADGFGLDQEQVDRLLGGEVDLRSLRTVNDIVDFILSVSPQFTSIGSDAVS